MIYIILFFGIIGIAVAAKVAMAVKNSRSSNPSVAGGSTPVNNGSQRPNSQQPNNQNRPQNNATPRRPRRVPWGWIKTIGGVLLVLFLISQARKCGTSRNSSADLSSEETKNVTLYMGYNIIQFDSVYGNKRYIMPYTTKGLFMNFQGSTVPYCAINGANIQAYGEIGEDIFYKFGCSDANRVFQFKTQNGHGTGSLTIFLREPQ